MAARAAWAAALASASWVGRGDEKAADQAAVNAMRDQLNMLDIKGTVVIGEGERDEAPMLFIGEEVGAGGPDIDIALDPLEGTTITAKGGTNAMAVLAMAEAGGFLHAPDVYMDKIAVGGGLPKGLVDLDLEPEENLKRVAEAKGKVTLEASGGVNLDTVRGIAETGVDIISVGALTHSAPNFDIGLDES